MSTGSLIAFTTALLYLGVAGLAFRLARWTRGRWGWAVLAAAMAISALRRIQAGLDLWAVPGPGTAAEWIPLGVVLLVGIGLLGVRGHFKDADAQMRAAADREAAVQARQADLGEVLAHGELLERVVETADVWINTLDLEARVVLWNREAERISGYGRAEVVGRSDIWVWLYPDEAYRQEIAVRASAILQRGEAVRDFETSIRTRYGEDRILSWNSQALADADGVVRGSLAIARDVTALRRTEGELQRVHALQALVLDHSLLGIAFVRARQFVWVNRRLGELLGRQTEGLIGAGTRVIYASDQAYEELGATAYPQMEQGAHFDRRIQLQRGDGTLIWCRLMGRALHPGRVQDGSIWIFEDVGERMAAEESLRESEARFRGVFEGTHDALLLLTREGVFECNQRAVDLFRFPRKEELFRLHPADLSPQVQPGGEPSRPLADHHLHEAFAQGSAHFRWAHRTRDGEVFHADVLLSAFSMGRRKVIQACIRKVVEE